MEIKYCQNHQHISTTPIPLKGAIFLSLIEDLKSPLGVLTGCWVINGSYSGDLEINTIALLKSPLGDLGVSKLALLKSPLELVPINREDLGVNIITLLKSPLGDLGVLTDLEVLTDLGVLTKYN
ncbi:MAG TPA: hypothetical protein P5210_09450 [Draconibacterium sp.]|nr:hypothetical protein [Draconibacterium sp.]HRX11862.1 hypothetical protein [Draconibacterium sp.]